MGDKLTNEELVFLDNLEDDVILELFDSPNKRYTIRKIIQKAFLMGKKSK